MFELNEKAKAEIAKYIDSSGKLIIDDSLPDEVKKIFQYFNDNNLDIMNINVDDIINLPKTENFDESFEDSNYDEIVSSENNYDDTLEEEKINDLNDMF